MESPFLERAAPTIFASKGHTANAASSHSLENEEVKRLLNLIRHDSVERSHAPPDLFWRELSLILPTLHP